jgi:hypothetical protein
MRLRQSHYDPFNATGISSFSNTLSNLGTDEAKDENTGEREANRIPTLEDENIRKVLDSIDIKIGQAIEEKEEDISKMHVIQRQITEAKDSFTNAYKSYKALKKIKKS